jgi:aminodeoxyfutalosine synthase
VTLTSISEKVNAGVPLSFEDGVALFHEPDLLKLGALANQVRERRYGDRTTFNRNLHINPTNLCVASCALCSFSRRSLEQPGAYTLSLSQAWDKLKTRLEAGDPVTEVHVVGGLSDSLPFDYYTDLLAGLKRRLPSLHIKAFSAVEIFHFHKLFQLQVREVLQHLRAAGLDSLPGGGAEIFASRVRQRICPNKCNAQEWLDVHRTAHQMGLRSNCIHPLGLSPREQFPCASSCALGGRRSAGVRSGAACAAQYPAHQGLLGFAGDQDRADRTVVRR